MRAKEAALNPISKKQRHRRQRGKSRTSSRAKTPRVATPPVIRAVEKACATLRSELTGFVPTTTLHKYIASETLRNDDPELEPWWQFPQGRDCRVSRGAALSFVEGRALLSLSIEGIGKASEVSLLDDKKIATEPISAASYGEGTASLFRWWESRTDLPQKSAIDAVAVRVVHGARDFDRPALVDQQIIDKIERFEKLTAPCTTRVRSKSWGRSVADFRECRYMQSSIRLFTEQYRTVLRDTPFP